MRYEGTYPKIDDEAIARISSLSTQNLGGGVIVFEKAFDPNQATLLPWIDEQGKAAHEQRWRYDVDEAGNRYAVNEDGNKFSLEQVNEVPVRVLNVVEDHTEQEMVDFFRYLEDRMYECVIRYTDEFPMVLPTLWWRTRGHALRYSAGNYLGIHNDNDTNYRSSEGKRYIPKGQLGARQTVAIMAYFNDCAESPDRVGANQYSGGELFFPYLGVEHPAKAGDIVIFPCNFYATHGVRTVTAGVRYGYLTFYAQGSPHHEVLVDVGEPSDVKTWCYPHWLDPLYDDYKKYCLAVEYMKDQATLHKKPNPLFQNRTLEGEDGLKKPYAHDSVIGANQSRGRIINPEELR